LSDAGVVPSQARDDEVLRVFVALPLQEEVREALGACERDLKRSGAHVGWVKPENIHLTLSFLGDTFRARVPEIATVMDHAAGSSPPIRFEVRGLGWFGSPKSPRVVWAGVREEGGALPRLQQAVAEGVAQLGFAPESRSFTPHVTLGRVRSSRGVRELTSRIASANNTPFGWVSVDRMVLMRSQLESHGARYTVLHEAHLKGTAAYGDQDQQNG